MPARVPEDTGEIDRTVGAEFARVEQVSVDVQEDVAEDFERGGAQTSEQPNPLFLSLSFRGENQRTAAEFGEQKEAVVVATAARTEVPEGPGNDGF